MISLYFYTGHVNKQSTYASNGANKGLCYLVIITPELVNFPADILRAIPLQGIYNSATGDGPKDTRGYISAAVTNTVVSVANFVYNGLVAVGNLIEKAGEIVVKLYMKLFSTVVSVVKATVEAVERVVTAAFNWIVEQIKSIFGKWKYVIEGEISNYKEEVLEYFEGKKNVRELSLVLDGSKFSYEVIGATMGLGVLATIMTGGVASCGSLVGKVLGNGISGTLIDYIGRASGLIGFAIGSLLRASAQWIVDHDSDLDDNAKKAVLTIADMIVAVTGIVVTQAVGNSDIENLALGYIIFIGAGVLEYTISHYGENEGLTKDEIEKIVIILKGVLLSTLVYLSLTSLIKMTISDVVAGLFGFIDELILGYLFTSSLFEFGESVEGIVNEILGNISRR